ncbi:hypothetical protein GW17_00029762, partial [Ensete ventricosum]
KFDGLVLQLYAGQIIWQHDHTMSVRSYAKEAAPSNLPPLKGDGKSINLGLKKDVTEAMESQLRREEFKDEQMVAVKSLDIRNFI